APADPARPRRAAAAAGLGRGAARDAVRGVRHRPPRRPAGLRAGRAGVGARPSRRRPRIRRGGARVCRRAPRAGHPARRRTGERGAAGGRVPGQRPDDRRRLPGLERRLPGRDAGPAAAAVAARARSPPGPPELGSEDRRCSHSL
ncbi:MAG: putative membrane protein, partial [uncultured Nocardioidaceae bacterium]